MVALDIVKASNATLARELPPNLVAVFVGGTSGIGEITLKLLAKHAIKPRIYIVGRSAENAERIIAECRGLNKDGEYLFVQKSLSLLKVAEELCEEIKSKEKSLNLLFLTIGVPDMSVEKNEDGLRPILATHVYVRHYIAQTLLPLIQAAPGLRRIVDVAGGSKEGEILTDDWNAERCSRSKIRSHLTTMKTLAWMKLAEQAPDVSIVTDFPGLVVTPIFTRIGGFMGLAFRIYASLLGWLLAVPLEESAERHVFLSTSSSYAPSKGDFDGVSLVKGLGKHTGIDGKEGSGLYSVNWDCEGPGEKVVTLLQSYRNDGTMEKVWNWIQGEYTRVLGHAL